MAAASQSLPAKVQRRARRAAGQGVRALKRASGAGPRKAIVVTTDTVADIAATLTPWAARRPLLITASGPSSLRALAAAVDPAASTSSLRIELALPEGWPTPTRTPRLDLPGLAHHSITIKGRRWVVEIRTAREVQLAAALWAAASAVTPAAAPFGNGSPDVHLAQSGDPTLGAWAVGHWMHAGDYPDSDAREVEATAALTVPAARPAVPMVDPTVANPIGLSLSRMTTRSIANATLVGGHLTIAAPEGNARLDIPSGRPLDEHDVQRLRRWAGVRVVVTSDHHDMLDAASRLAALAATGLVTTVEGDAPAGVTDALSEDLATTLRLPLPADTGDRWADRLTWQAASARQRRAALTSHASPLVLGRASCGDPLPEVSVLLVTNRPERIAEAVAGLRAQTYPRFEIIVGLHGSSEQDLPDAATVTLAATDHPTTIVAIEAEAPLGDALSRCTSAAGGTLLLKVDDDDVYGPNHIWDLVLARMYSGADLLGKAPEVTELQSSDQLILRGFAPEETWGAYIIGATMMVSRSALIDVGGWRPTPWAVDKALLDRFGRSGRGIYRAQNLGWIYVRRGAGHTWEQSDDYFRGQAKAVWNDEQADAVRTIVLGA